MYFWGRRDKWNSLLVIRLTQASASYTRHGDAAPHIGVVAWLCPIRLLYDSSLASVLIEVIQLNGSGDGPVIWLIVDESTRLNWTDWQVGCVVLAPIAMLMQRWLELCVGRQVWVPEFALHSSRRWREMTWGTRKAIEAGLKTIDELCGVCCAVLAPESTHSRWGQLEGVRRGRWLSPGCGTYRLTRCLRFFTLVELTHHFTPPLSFLLKAD